MRRLMTGEGLDVASYKALTSSYESSPCLPVGGADAVRTGMAVIEARPPGILHTLLRQAPPHALPLPTALKQLRGGQLPPSTALCLLADDAAAAHKALEAITAAGGARVCFLEGGKAAYLAALAQMEAAAVTKQQRVAVADGAGLLAGERRPVGPQAEAARGAGVGG
jgi:hypothetical protein